MRAIAILLILLSSGAMAASPGWRWRLPDGVAPPPVPADNPMSPAKVELGRRLFYDADLSIDGTMSCASCHEQKRAFTDGNRTRPGVHGDPGRRNVPGLANVARARSLTWGDPRVTTLEQQVAIPVFGRTPVEMGMAGAEGELTARLGRDACYRRMFAAAFPESGGAVTVPDVSRALAAFQRTMLSHDAPWDMSRAGKAKALSLAAARGAATFDRLGCVACHGGQDLGDGAFRALPGTPGPVDRGLGEITGRAGDDGKFRTPGLRNVALTAPYLHDGSAATLAEAIARHGGAASGLPGESRADLIAFLDALTDRRFVTDKHLAMPDKACGRRL